MLDYRTLADPPRIVSTLRCSISIISTSRLRSNYCVICTQTSARCQHRCPPFYLDSGNVRWSSIHLSPSPSADGFPRPYSQPLCAHPIQTKSPKSRRERHRAWLCRQVSQVLSSPIIIQRHSFPQYPRRMESTPVRFLYST